MHLVKQRLCSLCRSASSYALPMHHWPECTYRTGSKKWDRPCSPSASAGVSSLLSSASAHLLCSPPLPRCGHFSSSAAWSPGLPKSEHPRLWRRWSAADPDTLRPIEPAVAGLGHNLEALDGLVAERLGAARRNEELRRRLSTTL